MAKKSKRKRLVKQLDAVCNELIKLRDEHTCQYCLKVVSGQGCHWAHIIGGRGLYLRWDVLNSIVLCFHHHQLWHRGNITFDGWFRAKFKARWLYLTSPVLSQAGMFMERRYIVWKFTNADLEEKLARLKQKLKELKSEIPKGR